MTELLLGLAITFGLVLTRLGTFLVVSPFPGPAVPVETRAGLAIVMTFALVPGVAQARASLGPEVLSAILAETMTGVTIGFVFRVAMSAADVLGGSIGQVLGLSMAATYDPLHNQTLDPVSRLVTALGTTVALSIGAHRVVLGALLASFATVPLGANLDLASSGSAVFTLFERSAECGLRLAIPAISVTISVQLVLGLAARAAPALQSFGVGLPLALASGIVVLIDGGREMLAGLASHLGDISSTLESVLTRG